MLCFAGENEDLRHDDAGRILVEKKVATCPDAIACHLTKKTPYLVRLGLRPVPSQRGSGTS